MEQFLRAELRARQWTVPQLAEACGVSPGLATKWISTNPRYRVTPSPASCEKIAEALGVNPDIVLELAGHRPNRNGSDASAEVDVRRQVVRDQLDRWLTAVGPENEEFFWQHLKAQGDSTVDLIQQIGTAVNAEGDAAVNAAVSGRATRGRRSSGKGKGPLKTGQHPASDVLNNDRRRLSHRQAA